MYGKDETRIGTLSDKVDSFIKQQAHIKNITSKSKLKTSRCYWEKLYVE